MALRADPVGGYGDGSGGGISTGRIWSSSTPSPSPSASKLLPRRWRWHWRSRWQIRQRWRRWRFRWANLMVVYPLPALRPKLLRQIWWRRVDLRVLLFVLFVLLCLCDDVVAVIDFLFIFLGGGSGGTGARCRPFFFFFIREISKVPLSVYWKNRHLSRTL